MSEVMTENVEQVTVRCYALCPKCGKRLTATGCAYMTSPPQYPHECSCGAQVALTFVSGEIRYMDKQNNLPPIATLNAARPV